MVCYIGYKLFLLAAAPEDGLELRLLLALPLPGLSLMMASIALDAIALPFSMISSLNVLTTERSENVLLRLVVFIGFKRNKLFRFVFDEDKIDFDLDDPMVAAIDEDNDTVAGAFAGEINGS